MRSGGFEAKESDFPHFPSVLRLATKKSVKSSIFDEKTSNFLSSLSSVSYTHLKRKIETYLANWKEAEGRKPLVIKGIRQCGKAYIVQKFARENYESVVYMNFILEPDKKSAFTGNIDVDTIILNLSALIQGSRFIEGKTCIILDEIQECKEARRCV